jgi:hypothetical protein
MEEVDGDGERWTYVVLRIWVIFNIFSALEIIVLMYR